MPEEAEVKQDGEVKEESGKRKLILILAGVLILLGAVGGGLWAFGVIGGGEAESEAPPPPLQVNQVLAMEPVVVNLSTGRKMSYARLGLALGFAVPDEAQPAINLAILGPKVKDRLLVMVAPMTAEDLLKPETKDQLKAAVLEFIRSQMVGSEAVLVEVYITDFVIQ